MDPPQVSMPSTVPIEPTLVPTTDEIAEECPRFRILIVGRPGVGKSSLINAIFKISLTDVRHFEAGTAKINEGITSPHNKHLVIHNSEGYEPGDEEKFRILEKFITERSQKKTISKRLHAIWLCISAPYDGGSIFQSWGERIFRLNQRKVPMIVVYTKFDLFMVNDWHRREWKGDGSLESAEKYFNEKYGQLFTKNIEGQIPYTIVSKFQPETLLRLVETTRQNIRAESASLLRWLSPGSVEDFLDATRIAFTTAQRVDTSDKIDASIKVGKKKYWRAITSGRHFQKFSLEKCLDVIHKDLVAIWNIREMEEFFLSDVFSRQMLVFVGELCNQDQGNDSSLAMMAPAGLANLWASGIYKRCPEHVCCLMGYVVDLTLILQAVFLVSLQDHSEGKVLLDRVKEVIYKFYFSEKKKRIHNAIRDFQPLFTKGDVVDKIEFLLKDNEMTKIDTHGYRTFEPSPLRR
ncbi:hypothetical protein F5887DRAFT_1285910 [Amanita rubescens]|nr:hypothetical protein F5887DRAFT_1285910 [Amanita rubescens]